MRPQLNHTIVHATDPEASARFLADVLGFDPPGKFGPFVLVETGNGVSLDFLGVDEVPHTSHYAFLVTEAQWDVIFDRIVARNLPYWADPGCTQEGETNTHDGGRGVYFPDPDGHLLEIITRPYGSGPA